MVSAHPEWPVGNERAWRRHFDDIADAVATLHATAERTLQRQMRLAAIAAPTGAEQERARAMRLLFEGAGCVDVQEDDAGNVIARVIPLRPELAARAPVSCMAHLDTVFSADTLLEPERDGDVVRCPGIGDNGRGLAAAVTLAGALGHGDIRALLQRPIEFVATVGEEGEGNLRGARRYFEAREEHSAPPPFAAIALDGPGDSAIVHHAIASVRLRVSLRGPGGHSWTDRDAVNAVHLAAHIVATIARYASAVGRDASATVTRMGGGETLTSVPRTAWFDIDIRARVPAMLARVRTEVQDIVYRAAACAPGTVECHVTLLEERPGGSMPSSHPLARLAEQATAWCGAVPASAMASTDANIPLSRGIPAIAIGAGGTGGNAHTTDEWFDNTNAARGVARAFALLVGAARA